MRKKISSKEMSQNEYGKMTEIGNFETTNSILKIDLQGTQNELTQEDNEASPTSPAPNKSYYDDEDDSPYKNQPVVNFKLHVNNLEREDSVERAEPLLDSQEAKVIVGKPEKELKFRKQLKEKLRVTKVPEMRLKDVETEVTHKFNELYEFVSFLGTGSFGFVVQAKDRNSGEMMALKVSIF